MRKLLLQNITSSCLLFLTYGLLAQSIWVGPRLTFTKNVGSDWMLEENQDRITDNVWLTRADTRSIFNMAQETDYTNNFSPVDTEWAFGTTNNIDSLEFAPWEVTTESPLNSIDKNMVVHLITDDIYIDIKFTEWTGGGSGAGFTYERSTDQTSNIIDFNSIPKISIFPNPSPDIIQVSGLLSPTKAEIFDTKGQRVLSGMMINNTPIHIYGFMRGVYFMRFENGPIVKFIKE